jgi:hypothetical protein
MAPGITILFRFILSLLLLFNIIICHIMYYSITFCLLNISPKTKMNVLSCEFYHVIGENYCGQLSKYLKYKMSSKAMAIFIFQFCTFSLKFSYGITIQEVSLWVKTHNGLFQVKVQVIL